MARSTTDSLRTFHVTPLSNGAAPHFGGADEDDARRLAGLSLDADFLRTLIEETNRCFFLIDPRRDEKSLVYISPAFDRIWARPREEFYRDSQTWYRTIHPDDLEGATASAELRMGDTTVRQPPFEYRILWPDGSVHWVRGNVILCTHGVTGEQLLCGTAEDITEAKRYEAERIAAHAALEETVAHRTDALTRANAALQSEIDRRAAVERELREKQAFLERMLRYQEWDRTLVSLEIHDGAIQNVVAALLHVDAVAGTNLPEPQRVKLAVCAELLQAAIAESRRVISGMRPQTLDDLGLRAALEELAAHNEQQGLTVHLSCDYAPAGRAPMVDTTVYRLAQESLNNVRLHARTDEARVELRREGEKLVLKISDEGRGFDPTLGIEGFGLHGLRERAKAVGGEVRIQSSPGRGTVVTAILPPLDPVDSAARERDHAAAALAVNRLRLQHILDGTTAVIFVKDHEFRYELINHQWQRLFDMTRDDVIGKTDFDLFPPDVAAKLRENDRRVLAENRPITLEESVPSSNGEVREYVVAKFPIPCEKGGPHSLCGIATDITDQKRHLRALEETRRRFTAFMDNSPLLAWIKDASGKYVFANRRTIEVLKLQREQVLGHTDFEIFPAEWAHALHEHDQEVLAQGGTHEFREFCPIGSGPPLPWQSCKFRLQADDGSYLVGGVALDVSTASCSPCDTI